MFNIRKFAICGLLVAAVLVNTSTGYPNNRKTFGDIINLINEVKLRPTGIYYQPEQLRKVADDFKLWCLEKFEKGIWTQEKYTPHHAYCVVDDACKEFVRQLKVILRVARFKSDDEIDWQFDSMLEKGNIMQFFVHKNNHNIDNKKMKTEKERLMELYKGQSMFDNEAELWVIIHKYDEGILGDHYSKKKPKNSESTSLTPKPGDYVPIMVRFDDLKASVQKVADGPSAAGTFKYQIDDLDKVEYNFKLKCLRKFEAKLDKREAKKGNQPTQIDENKPNLAYEALDEVCNSYVDDIIQKTTSKDRLDIIKNFRKMLRERKFIQFLVDKGTKNWMKRLKGL